MLPKIEISETRETPKVLLDPENNKFEISGNSMPENAYGFYSPINEWFTKYLNCHKKPFEINFKIKYFNSSSTKEFFELFSIIEKAVNANCKVNWYVEDGDELIEELGYEIQEVIDIPIEVIHGEKK